MAEISSRHMAAQGTSEMWKRDRPVALAVLVAALTLALALLAAPGRASTPGAEQTPLLADEDVYVWPGRYVEHVQFGHPDRCNTSPSRPCWDHEFDVAEGVTGALRVAIDARLAKSSYVRDWADPAVTGQAHSPESAFRMDVHAPGGEVHTSNKQRPYTQEIWVHEPAPGRWRVRVIPVNVEERIYRVRAGIDVLEPVRADGAPLYPNLRAVPAFELTFNVPTTNYGPGLDHASTTGACMLEESVEGVIELERTRVDVDCLRFSFGMENDGDGPLMLETMTCDLECRDLDWVTAAHQRWMQTSRSPAPDPGEPFRTPADGRTYAGSARFDPTHLHTHYEEAWGAKLLRVETDGWKPGDRPPEVEEVGMSPKLGFDPSAEAMTDFRKLSQDNSAWVESRPGRIVLAAGWADNYEWNRSGNAIPLDGPIEPGWYLLQTFVDPFGFITETNDDDNTSYTLFEVTAAGAERSIVIHERGVGTASWERPRAIATTIP